MCGDEPLPAGDSPGTHPVFPVCGGEPSTCERVCTVCRDYAAVVFVGFRWWVGSEYAAGSLGSLLCLLLSALVDLLVCSICRAESVGVKLNTPVLYIA